MPKKPNPELLDDENPAWTAADLARARSASEVLPVLLGAEGSTRLLKPRGRPRVENPKVRINISLSPVVVAHFKHSGEGWQTRIDTALRQSIADQPPAR